MSDTVNTSIPPHYEDATAAWGMDASGDAAGATTRAVAPAQMAAQAAQPTVQVPVTQSAADVLSTRQAPPVPPSRRSYAAATSATSTSQSGANKIKKAKSTATQPAPAAPKSVPAKASSVSPEVLMPPKLTFKERFVKKVAEYTSPLGVAKLAAKGGLWGLAGVGVYTVVQAIIHAVHVGISAKVAAVLIPVGAAVAGTALLITLGIWAYKGLRKVNENAKEKAAAIDQERFQTLVDKVAEQKTADAASA